MRRTLICLLLCLGSIPAEAGRRLTFYAPDTGIPPFIVVAPDRPAPSGIVVDLLEATARQEGRQVVYDFKARKHAAAALTLGMADAALFFSQSRPAPRGVVLSRPMVETDVILVTRGDAPLNYSHAGQLAGRRLCTLSNDRYPSLEGAFERRQIRRSDAKTEQAQLIMLQNEGCDAALLNGAVFRWLDQRFHFTAEMAVEPLPLLSEDVTIGFLGTESGFAAAFNRRLAQWRASGELARVIRRHAPAAALVSIR